MKQPVTLKLAAKNIIFYGWWDLFERDVASGNGFQIAGYGIFLIARYFAYFMLRVVTLILLPITAPLIMYAARRYERTLLERRNKAAQKARDSYFSSVKRVSEDV